MEKNVKMYQGMIVEANQKMDVFARTLNDADSTKKNLQVESQDLTRQIEECENAMNVTIFCQHTDSDRVCPFISNIIFTLYFLILALIVKVCGTNVMDILGVNGAPIFSKVMLFYILYFFCTKFKARQTRSLFSFYFCH